MKEDPEGDDKNESIGSHEQKARHLLQNKELCFF